MRKAATYANFLFTVINVKRQTELANKHDPKYSWKKSHSKAKTEQNTCQVGTGTGQNHVNFSESTRVWTAGENLKTACVILVSSLIMFLVLPAWSLTWPMQMWGLQQADVNMLTVPCTDTVQWSHFFAGLTETLSVCAHYLSGIT